MDRRAFLIRIGSATLVIAGTGSVLAYRDGVFSTGEGPAFTPWKAGKRTEEARLDS
jgi:hypothetical protein